MKLTNIFGGLLVGIIACTTAFAAVNLQVGNGTVGGNITANGTDVPNLTVHGNETVTSNLTISGTTATTSNNTGALTVAGGVGVAGDVYSTGAIYSNVTGGSYGILLMGPKLGHVIADNDNLSFRLPNQAPAKAFYFQSFGGQTYFMLDAQNNVLHNYLYGAIFDGNINIADYAVIQNNITTTNGTIVSNLTGGIPVSTTRPLWQINSNITTAVGNYTVSLGNSTTSNANRNNYKFIIGYNVDGGNATAGRAGLYIEDYSQVVGGGNGTYLHLDVDNSAAAATFPAFETFMDTGNATPQSWNTRLSGNTVEIRNGLSAALFTTFGSFGNTSGNTTTYSQQRNGVPITFSTNNQIALKQKNAAGTFALAMVWYNGTNVMQIGDSNAVGVAINSGSGATTVNNGLTVNGTATINAVGNTTGVGAGTITNAPQVGNPSKWIPITSNGTVYYIPAWQN